MHGKLRREVTQVCEFCRKRTPENVHVKLLSKAMPHKTRYLYFCSPNEFCQYFKSLSEASWKRLVNPSLGKINQREVTQRSSPPSQHNNIVIAKEKRKRKRTQIQDKVKESNEILKKGANTRSLLERGRTTRHN